jgi:hypothetical protein
MASSFGKGGAVMLSAILIGVGATAFMDLASIVRARLGAPFPDYGLVGRWLAHAARGRAAHEAIARSAPVKGEALIGWTAHYVIGIGYAALLLLAVPGWEARPTLAPAMVVGVGTVLAPFLVMQPAWAPASSPRVRPIPMQRACAA